jgi:hypothetical protein
MSKLLAAMQTNDVLTLNGMPTNSSSLNHCVNLFFQIGALRGQDKVRLINAFTKAFGENPLTAMKLLFWARDVRGGAGERQIFRDIVEYLAKNRKDSLSKNLHLISEFGRWDDLLVLVGTPLEKEALDLIAKGLADKNGLVAKWMPRPNVSNRQKKIWAAAVRQHMGLSPKEYRKLLVENSNTVEQLMCANEWSAIQYSKLPSKAMSDLMKAFTKHDKERFAAYLESVNKGEAKINAGAVYPYDIVKNLRFGDKSGANTQWNALPNYLEGNKERFLPVVDVSGSMSCPAGNNPNVTCMDVAISLGLYISERNVGPFKDAFVTFSNNPKLQILNGNLQERFSQLSRAEWDMSTNVEAVFNLILQKAKSSNVPAEEMPTMILIMSDMEFNSGTRGNFGLSAQQMFEKMYAEAGYNMPKIVYWNIQAKSDNFPVHFDKNGVALVSGFSPSLLTNLLGGKDLTPMSMMLEVINSERYSVITV